MSDFLNIPGNIRQQYLPFTLNGPGKTQVFSFRDKQSVDTSCPFGQINPFSSQIGRLIANDSSIQYTHGPNGKKKIELNEFLNSIPKIQIREFVPDAKLTQTFKWFSYFKQGFDAGLGNVLEGKSFADKEKIIKDLMVRVQEKLRDLTSGSAPKLKDIVKGLASEYQDRGFNIGEDNGFAVLFLPFILYYRLTTTRTNNVYEIPYSMENDIMKSDGTYGWTSNQSDFGFIDRGFNTASEAPILKMLLGNTVKINTMPSFQPTGETHGDTITVTIDLINDTADAAAKNFLMCHTLFGNNRWLQYGFVQTGASLYDLKLPGANRYFMCAGSFVCKGKGVFRSPSEAVLKTILNGCEKTRAFSDFLKEGDGSFQEEMVQSIIDQRIEERRRKVDSQTRREYLSARDDSEKSDPQSQQITQRTVAAGQTAVNSTSCCTFSSSAQNNGAVQTSNSHSFETAEDFERYDQARSRYTRLANATSRLKNAETEYGNAEAAAASAYTAWENAKAELDECVPKTEEWYEAQSKEIAARIARDEADSAFDRATEEINRVKDELGKEFPDITADSGKLEAATAEAKRNLEEFGQQEFGEQARKRVGEIASAKITANSTGEIRELIKIPDVYSLTLTFTSLLPDNFNNYLYGFRAANLDPIKNFAENPDTIGVFEKLVDRVADALK